MCVGIKSLLDSGQGHINIAQTRHFRGPQTVGESQYPANIAAILKAQMYVSPSSAGIYDYS